MFRSSFKPFFRLLACLGALLLTSVPVRAYEAFTIENYSVEVTVDRSRVHHVRENLDLSFFGESHGLMREIPLSSSQEPYMIENVSVDGDPFSLERGTNVLGVRMGDPYSYVSGPKNYCLSYDMLYARDGDRENDIVYVTPIGTDFETPIRSASVKLTLPTDEIKSLTVYRGGYGQGVEIDGARVEGNTVTIDNVYLNSLEGLTFYVELPEGIFDSAPRSLTPVRDLTVLGLIALAAIMVALAFVRWLKIGRDERIIPTVEFYPPEGMNPAELSYIANHGVNTSAISAMIFFWASKGYLKYSEKEGGAFELEKAGDMGDERPLYEQRAFNALFENGNTVTSDYIETNYYDTAQSVIVHAVESFNGERALDDKNNAGAARLQYVLCQIPLWIYGIIGLFSHEDMSFIGVVAMLILPIFVYALTSSLIQRKNGNKIFSAILIFFIGIGGSIFVAPYMESRFFGSMPRCFLLLSLGVIGAFISALIQKRTDYATRITGRCMGFREFLVTAEKDRLEALVKENPSYFFDTLPFAFVLGVTDVWAGKFEGMIKEPPAWYNGYYGGYPFMPIYMTRSVVRASSGLSAAYAQRAVKNSGGSLGGLGGGGFSGGGFSGGGGGGGGGHAW